MISLRRSKDRGRTQWDWLDSYHTFSFGDYHDPQHQRFRALRVINEDFIAPGQGFGTHPHRDMEIVTYILSGSLKHQDSMGNGSVIRPGDVQRMSAGTGVTHSEFNPSAKEPVHLLQIWIFPEEKGLQPTYEQHSFEPDIQKNKLCLIASGDSKDKAVKIHQDVHLYVLRLDGGKTVSYEVSQGRSVWIQGVKGHTAVNGVLLDPGDGAAVTQEKGLNFTAKGMSEVLMFDLA